MNKDLKIPSIVTKLLWSYEEENCPVVYQGFISEVPPSVNSQYIGGWAFKKGGGRQFNLRLTPEAKGFRDRLIITNPGLRNVRPKGIMAIVAVFYYPWVSTGRKVRTKDDDNLVKPFRDAVKNAIGIDDSYIFHTHSFKANSNRQGIRFWILDMGTTVHYYEP